MFIYKCFYSNYMNTSCSYQGFFLACFRKKPETSLDLFLINMFYHFSQKVNILKKWIFGMQLYIDLSVLFACNITITVKS